MWWSSIRPGTDSAKRIPRMRAQAQCPLLSWYSFIVLVTYVTHGPSFLKIHTAYAFILTFANNNHIGILHVLYILTETMLVTPE